MTEAELEQFVQELRSLQESPQTLASRLAKANKPKKKKVSIDLAVLGL